ncbi:hypothetical protein GVAV_003476 [Gurleya vavrai]
MAIKYMKQARNENSRLMRYSLQLQEYDFIVNHIKGQTNGADYLSRIDHIHKVSNMPKRKLDILKILTKTHIFLGHGSFYNMRKFLNNSAIQIKSKTIKNFVKSCDVCKKAGNKIYLNL